MRFFKNIQNYDIVHEQLITDQTIWKQYCLINTCRSMEDISSSRQTFLYREEPEELFLTNSPTSYGPAEMLSADSISNILEISPLFPSLSLSVNAVRMSEQLNPAGISPFLNSLNHARRRFKTITFLGSESCHIPTSLWQTEPVWTKDKVAGMKIASSVMETDPYLGKIRHSVSSSAGGSRSRRSCEADTLTDR